MNEFDSSNPARYKVSLLSLLSVEWSYVTKRLISGVIDSVT
jgi:hypothetical protein